MIFVAVEGTFVCFTKGHDHFISNSIRCGCLGNDQCNIACLQTEMFLDTLCSKKWYDMPHIGCGIHSRIGRHSAVYN